MVNVEQLFTTQLGRPFLASVKVGASCIDVVSCWVQVWQMLMACSKMWSEAHSTAYEVPLLAPWPHAISQSQSHPQPLLPQQQWSLAFWKYWKLFRLLYPCQGSLVWRPWVSSQIFLRKSRGTAQLLLCKPYSPSGNWNSGFLFWIQCARVTLRSLLF